MLELVAALKHDLGKYVAWRSVNFDEQAWTGPLGDDLLQALQDDILRTHAERPAWQVWQRHVQSLQGAFVEPELQEVADAVGVLERHGAALRDADREAVAAARPEIRQAQSIIRARLRDLHRRLLRG